MVNWIIVALLIPFFLNQLDIVAGKLMKLVSALRYRYRKGH